MKKKLTIIIIIGIILAFLIYKFTINKKIDLLAIGDGFANGMTAFNINGYSYNNYLRDYYKRNNLLKTYLNYSYSNITSKDLLEIINENNEEIINGQKKTIQQAISKANIITISVGMDELANSSINGRISKKVLKDYYNNINDILYKVDKINNGKIVMLGLYETYNLKNIPEINHNLNIIANKYNVQFMDISYIVADKEYHVDESSYLNYKGHERISRELINFLG